MSCSFECEGSPCGSFGDTSEIIPLVKCTVDMSSHLISLGVSSKRGRRSLPSLDEWQLILNRAGIFGKETESATSKTICPKHRRLLTMDWPGRKNNACTYPSHRGLRKQLKSTRRVNDIVSAEIFAHFQRSVPIGSGKLDLDYYIKYILLKTLLVFCLQWVSCVKRTPSTVRIFK